MIGVIIINYHNEDKTISFIKEEISKISSSYAVVVVDNGSTDESLRKLNEGLKSYPEGKVLVVPSKENSGFARGNNLGVEVAFREFSPDLLLIANNDIRFETDDVVDRMAMKLLSIPEAAIIGPKVKGLDGRLQSPEPFVSFWKRHIWLYWSNLFMTRSRKNRVFSLDYSENAAEGFHYKLSGCFFMVKSEDWKSCGGMDPATFLYSEEMILSERLAKIGKKAYYYPEVSVLHEHGATTNKYYDKVAVRDMKFQSECYYYKNYIGTPAWQFPLAKATYFVKRLFKR